jgi:hypothetical protein
VGASLCSVLKYSALHSEKIREVRNSAQEIAQ